MSVVNFQFLSGRHLVVCGKMLPIFLGIVTLLGLGETGLHAGIIHRWSFTNTTGAISNSVGTVNGSVVALGGNSLRTNGFIRLGGGARNTTDYVQFPSGLVHSLTNLTMEVWATPNSAQNWSRLFDFGPGNDTQANNFFLSFCRGADLNAQRLEYGAPAAWTLDTGLATVAGTKYHYVATWSPTGGPNGGGLAQWYRNAVLAGSIDTGATTITNVNDAVLWLGRSQYPADNTAGADYDEVRIYNHILSQVQISTNFMNGPDVLVFLPPVASNDVMTLNPGAMALINVLKNVQAIGAPLDPASVTIVNSPAAGTAQVRTNGMILYTHNGGVAALDQFGYKVKDTAGNTSQLATVVITITNALRLRNTTIAIPSSPPPVGYQVVDAFPGVTFNQPLALQPMPGAANANKLFVVERQGYVSYLADVTATNPVRQVFLDITGQVSYDSGAAGERGLLGLAFHPGFATNGFFFVTYMADGGNPYFIRLARFTANPTNLTVNTNTQVILWSTTKREFNHNGSDLHFGLDGYLYVGMGDEGGQYNFHTNAQRLDGSLYSGLLRLDVDKRPGNLEPLPPGASIPILNIPTDGGGHAFYSIPADNPFLGMTNLYGKAVDTNHLRGEFYAIGFRHLWRFSIDPFSGEIWAGNVGQDLYEAVDLVRKGGNYGWPYYEGTHLTSTNYPGQPTMYAPPSGYVLDAPIYQYNHPAVSGTDPAFSGLDVNGSLAYHGTRIPQLTNAYIFGDFDLGGSIWALRRTNSSVSVERLTGQFGECAFGADPSNGDVLMCNYIQNKIQRLIYSDTPSSTYPARLSDTGIFADLTTLTPNPGIVSYDPIVSFWSDYAIKRRWFCIPDTTNKMTFATDANWTFPSGMMWIKHFDLELTRGSPATKKRIETRVIVKTTNACYGVSYQWNDAGTEAFLVPDGGTNFTINVLVGATNLAQQWEIPSRSSCLACHTAVAGHALSFNARELNQTTNMNGFVGNQLALLGQSGYLTANVTAPQTLPSFARANDATKSLEYRVRSYLSENCVQCHQPGGSGAQTWDARPWLTLDQTGLLNGLPNNNGGNPLNRLVVSGDTNHSVILQRLLGNGFGRMPPLATHQLDAEAISLLTAWISTELTNRQSFAAWQLAKFGSTNAASALATADPDHDGANNYLEYLTRTDPLNITNVWKLEINVSGNVVNVSYPQVPNLGVVIDAGTNLVNWLPWDVAGNQLNFGSAAGTVVLPSPFLPANSAQFFRARLIAP